MQRRLCSRWNTKTNSIKCYAGFQGAYSCICGLYSVHQKMANVFPRSPGANGGTTPLMMACQENHLKVAIALLSQDGIAVNKPMDDGSTPLIMASYCGNSSVVEQLLLSDTISTTETFDGNTAFDCANAGYRVASWFFY